MSIVDKTIEKRGWTVYRTIGDILPTYIEYHYSDKHALWADTNLIENEGEFAVKIFLVDIYEGEYAMNSQYCIEVNTAASGGDREYGHLLRGMTQSDIKIFYRKMKQLRRHYRRSSVGRGLRIVKRRNAHGQHDRTE